jgi:phosphodiester glycosidase
MKSKLKKIVWSAFIVLALCICGYLWYARGRPLPIPVKQKFYEGVNYRRVVRVLPRPMIAHVLVVDTGAKGIGFLVTPPDSQSKKPLNARTTSQFLEEFNLQIAVNGGGFYPWWSHSIEDYYPHVGDPVAPIGFTASNGKEYWVSKYTIGTEPTLYINSENGISFNHRPHKIYNAISGDRMLVIKGEIASGLDDADLKPRTAIGINQSGRYLYIVVVDGRQPFYSDGTTFADLAELLVDQGVYMGMSLDGGGSSTMVIAGEDGQPMILNSPIDNHIPGRERPVGNHLGIYVR